MNQRSLNWIHCNRCFDIYTKKQCAFYLLACYHVICDRCAQLKLGNTPNTAPVYNCCLCKKDVRGRQIGNNMPQHLKELFHPEPYMEDLPVSHILNFQNKHRQHLMLGTKRIARNQLKIEHNFQLARTAAQKKFESLEHMKRGRRRLDQRVRQIIAKRKEKQDMGGTEQQRTTSTNQSSTATSIFAQRPRPSSVSTTNRFTQPTHGYYAPRMPNPITNTNSESAVNSFTHKRNQSFIL